MLNMRTGIRWTLLLCLLALSIEAMGCGGGNNNGVIIIPTRTAAVTFTASATPIVTVTATTTATAIATATATLIATATASATSTASATPSATPTISAIVISPNGMALNNPTGPDVAAAAEPFILTFTAYDKKGNIIKPSASNQMTVNISGDFPSPNNVVTPDSMTISSGNSASFNYNGAYFPNILSVNAYIKDPLGGYALGTTTLIHANPVPCSSDTTQNYKIDLLSSSPDTLTLKASVGYNSSPTLETFTIDTGSLGVVVPLDHLGPDAIGPGAPGSKFYDSSGFTFSGNMYLATVSIKTEAGVVQTNPIEVLAINSSSCNKPGCKPPSTQLFYLGVGYDRNPTAAGDLFDSPSQNAFLNVTDTSNGTDIAQGYILTKNTTGGATLGVSPADLETFTPITLTPSSVSPGDWTAMAGCYGFPGLSGAPQFCGTLLLDVGIANMFIDLPSKEWPKGAVDYSTSPPSVSEGTEVSILAGNEPSDPAMFYQFTYEPDAPVGPAPTTVGWEDKPDIFVNTGRRPLLSFDYLYDSQCGETGFRVVK